MSEFRRVVERSAASLLARAERSPSGSRSSSRTGGAWTAGALAARCHQLVHGLRARGLGHGDAVAVLLPNGEPLVGDAARGDAGGLALGADQHLAHRERGGVDPRRLGRARLRRARALRGGGGGRGRRGGRAGGRAHRGGRRARLRALRGAARGPAGGAARGPPRRPVHAVHLGHHGAAEGGAARDARLRSRPDGGAARAEPRALRHHARRRPRAPRDLAHVPHGAALVRLLLAPLRPPGRADGPLRPRAGARADRAPPRHHHAHGADAAPPPDAAARGDAPPLRRLVAAPRDARRRAVPGRAEAQADRVVGPGGLRVLRRLRGRRHDGARRGVARAARHGRPALARRGRARARRRGQGPCRPARSARST